LLHLLLYLGVTTLIQQSIKIDHSVSEDIGSYWAQLVSAFYYKGKQYLSWLSLTM